MNGKQHSYELVIENLPKCIMYECKLPIRLNVNNIKTPPAQIIGYGLHERQPCEITVLDYRDEWADVIKKWYRYVFDTCSTKFYAISNHKIDGKVYEYDEYGNITVSFNVYGMFPIMLDEEYAYKDSFIVTFSADNVGELERVKGYKKENLFVKNVPTLDDAIENDHLSWDEYFANIALLAALRSKDKNTKVGAVIVSKEHKLLGMGYNGLPSGIDESLFPTERAGRLDATKYAYVIHAEQNALCNTTAFDLTGSSVYVTLFPCCYCASILIQRGIKEVIYLSDKHHEDPEYIASRKLFDAAGVVTRQYNGRLLLQGN